MRRELRRLAEALEKHFTDEGYAPIAGRVFTYMLLSPKAMPLEDLVHDLEVSKASASTETRRLERLGVLIRESRGKDRRAWYRLADDLAERLVDRRIQRVASFRELVKHTARQLPTRERAALRPRLVTIGQVYGDMLRALEGMPSRRKWGAKGAKTKVGVA